MNANDDRSERTDYGGLKSQYITLFPEEPADQGALEQIESQLRLRLPYDFRHIATFYSGGIVGGISHHAIASCGPGTNVVAETIRLRTSVKLPHSMLVLAEPPESIIILATEVTTIQSAVLWLDSSDVFQLNKIESIRSPQVWNSYAKFFEFLLQCEIDERE